MQQQGVQSTPGAGQTIFDAAQAVATPGAPVADTMGNIAPQAAPQYAGDPAMAAHKAAIRGIESGGNYQAIGPVNPSGDRAYGIDQVMGKNIPSWTQEALGYSMSPQEFLNNPAAQERVFEHKFGQYLSMGPPAYAASRWFTGQPLAGREGATDILGTTAGEYVNRYLAALGQEPLPQKSEYFRNRPGPGLPNPADEPMPVQPDYSQMNSWLNQGAPTPVDPQAQNQRLFNEILVGSRRGMQRWTLRARRSRSPHCRLGQGCDGWQGLWRCDDAGRE